MELGFAIVVYFFLSGRRYATMLNDEIAFVDKPTLVPSVNEAEIIMDYLSLNRDIEKYLVALAKDNEEFKRYILPGTTVQMFSPINILECSDPFFLVCECGWHGSEMESYGSYGLDASFCPKCRKRVFTNSEKNYWQRKEFLEKCKEILFRAKLKQVSLSNEEIILRTLNILEELKVPLKKEDFLSKLVGESYAS